MSYAMAKVGKTAEIFGFFGLCILSKDFPIHFTWFDYFYFQKGRFNSICVCARACCCCCLWVCGYIEFRVPNTSYLCVIRRSFNICSFLTVVVCTCSIQFSCYISFHFKCIYFPRSVFININLVIVK